MRQIKYKAKDVFTNKWRYGDLVHNQKVTRTGLEPRVMVGGYEVHPDTICQFTGFQDSDGNDVYENDIVDTFTEQFKIVWREDFGGFIIEMPLHKVFLQLVCCLTTL